MKTCIFKEICNCNQMDGKKEYKKAEDIEKKLTKDLEDAKVKLEKYENFERIVSVFFFFCIPLIIMS
jgi:hypothetical protein